MIHWACNFLYFLLIYVICFSLTAAQFNLVRSSPNIVCDSPMSFQLSFSGIKVLHVKLLDLPIKHYTAISVCINGEKTGWDAYEPINMKSMDPDETPTIWARKICSPNVCFQLARREEFAHSSNSVQLAPSGTWIGAIYRCGPEYDDPSPICKDPRPFLPLYRENMLVSRLRIPDSIHAITITSIAEASIDGVHDLVPENWSSLVRPDEFYDDISARRPIYKGIYHGPYRGPPLEVGDGIPF